MRLHFGGGQQLRQREGQEEKGRRRREAVDRPSERGGEAAAPPHQRQVQDSAKPGPRRLEDGHGVDAGTSYTIRQIPQKSDLATPSRDQLR